MTETTINKSIRTTYNFATAAVLDELLLILAISENEKEYSQTIEAIVHIATKAYTPAEA
tara:strand:- start:207 stop:383 length:177 start_codon:yes stop_codon:yes gene_type:complete